jgi:CheY-like chemotaxis protein
MLQRVVNVINYRTVERKQKFTVYVDRNIPIYIIGDDQRLAQVITNLVGNAVKFTPESGSVSIKTYLINDENGVVTIKIAVTDTGIGISKEQQANLFQSFQQAESSTSRKFGGTDLGLAISKNIVEMMGGSIEVESEVGKGSTFAFNIQVKKGESKHQSLADMGINWNDARILVVDDDAYILEDFKGIVQKLGVICDVAASASEALQLIKQSGGYNIYFIDWLMPDINGIELTRMIKEKSKTHDDSVVIMISAADSSAVAGEAKGAGVAKSLQKPLFPSTIANIIGDYLGVSEQQIKNEDESINGIFIGHCILVAEDVDINREIVMALLEPTLISIDFAENGAEAVRMFNEKSDKYEMIFMDVQMPEMDGYEATRNIRAAETPKAKDIPIIAMTANVFREDVEKCLAAGMNGHIGKPIDFDDVIKKLRTYLTILN